MKKYSLFIEYNNKRYYFMKFNFSVGNSTCFKYSFTKDVNQTLYCDTEGEVLSVFDEAFKTDKGRGAEALCVYPPLRCRTDGGDYRS